MKPAKVSTAKRRLWLLVPIALLLLLSAWYFTNRNAPANDSLMTKVKKGKFEIIVTTSGELRAKKQVKISAPGPEMMAVDVYNGVKISNLIAEGTVVKKGAFVAQLDQAPVMNKISEASLEVQKKTAEMTQSKLDTTLTLRDARDELSNLKFAVEQAKLTRDQSIYEAPAEQRRVAIELEKSGKTFEQKTQNYKTKIAQAETKVQIINSDLQKAQNKLNQLNDLVTKFTINAPEDGMLIYDKDWSGRKKGVGSEVQPWNPTVATLPDLSAMEVVTYVNEVDIQKIKAGQTAEIGLDADPAKKLKGVVIQVANVGEQRPNQDSKVFEVVIDVLTKDPDLRPSMTTSCRVHADTYLDALSIPLEAINNEKSVSYVFKREDGKLARRQIRIGAVNESEALIYAGLSEGDEVYLVTPADTTGVRWVLDKSGVKAPKPYVSDEEKRIRMKADSLKKVPRPPQQGSGGGDMIIIG
ncbi:MAG: HlyD family efflux transporter periplasmic adaptor subunit [Cytophagaceae bacterium]|nr:HlyD family efflux transporter periplasmic adaptor subunit [Cytophagaceae bacterium]